MIDRKTDISGVLLTARLLAALLCVTWSGEASAGESEFANIGTTVQLWTFEHSGDREGWVIPDRARGTVQGGALWITLAKREDDETTTKESQVLSPDGLNLNVATSHVNQIRLKILNLSPATDFLIRWRTKEN